MNCPKCNGKAKVNRTALDPETKEFYRRRICEKCGHAFYTIEFEIEDTPEFRKIWNDIAPHLKNNHNSRVKRNKNKIPPCPRCGSTVAAVDILEDEETGLLYKVFTCADCGREYEE